MSDLRVGVDADTRQAEAKIAKLADRPIKLNLKNSISQPLGRITGQVSEFNKSLEASNARVLAFGASAGSIFVVQKALNATLKSAIDVEKALLDINVVLGVSSKSLATFGNALFDIAKNTGQSFDVVAVAATELSRQGLGLEETLKRTQDALILTRLSGLDTASAVEALTATINSFSKAGLDSTTIINKLANVDASFAVSSNDLAEAVKRVGSSASEAGVGFDELLAIVTSVQQTTARGGAVIGNSLKTIFTRIQRTDTLDQLQNLGIQVRDLEGNTLPAIQVLSNLSNTFNQLGDSQKAQVGELVGGIFQINILKAALSDLGKEYSVYDRALQTSANSTDQAIQRNEALNQTLSALINQTFQNLTRISSSIGQISLGPTFKNTLDLLNKGLESLSSDSTSAGGKIGKGILEGIGTFISGPGLVLITAVFGKLLLNLGKFTVQSLGVLLNINTQSEQRAQIQAKVNEVLAKEPSLVAAIYNKQISVLEVENQILNIIKLQTIERAKAAAVSSTIAGGLIGRGVTTKGGSLKASAGFIPNFSASEIYGALAGGYTPGNIRQMNIPGQGNVTYNSAETVKNFPGMSQPAIMPPQHSKAGKNYEKQFSNTHGFNPYANRGFIPNFSATDSQRAVSYITEAKKYNLDVFELIKLRGYPSSKSLEEKIKKKQAEPKANLATQELTLAEQTEIRKIYSRISPAMLVPPDQSLGMQQFFYPPLGKNRVSLEYPVIPLSKGLTKQKEQIYKTQNKEQLIEQSKITVLDGAANYINSLGLQPPAKIVLPSELYSDIEKDTRYAGAKGALGGLLGAAFEVGIGKALSLKAAASEGGDFDVRGAKQIKKIQGYFPGSYNIADFKVNAGGKNPDSMKEKIIKEMGLFKQMGLENIKNSEIAAAKQGKSLVDFRRNLGVKKSQGFVPNFAALDDAISRETAAGTPTSRIRIGKNARLTSSANPLGLGVYNTKDEPMGLGQGVERYGSKAKTAGAAAGFIPNFAELSFNTGSKGAIMDPLIADKQVGASFARILAKLKTQEYTLDQANANLKQLTSEYGLAANSQNRFNQILQSRGSQFASSARSATLALDNSKKGFEKFGGAALAASFVVPMILQTVSQFNEGNKKLQLGINAASTALSLTAAGATFGVPGAIAGAAVGSGLGLYQYFEGLKGLDLEKLKNDIQVLQDEFNNTSVSMNQIIPLIEKYKEVQGSSLPDAGKEEALLRIQNQMIESIGKVGPEFSDGILKALKEEDYTQVSEIINKALIKKSAELSNLSAQAVIEGAGKNITDKSLAGGISKAVTGLQTSSGKNIIQDLSKTEEGKAKIGETIQKLDSLLLERASKEKQINDLIVTEEQIAQRRQAGEKEFLAYSKEKGSLGQKAVALIFGYNKALDEGYGNEKNNNEIIKLREDLNKELNLNLSEYLQAVKPLYQTTEEGRIQFQKLEEKAKESSFNQEAGNKVIKDTKAYLLNIKDHEEKIAALLKSGISTVDQYILGFKNNTLNAKDAQEFYKKYFALKNDPLKTLGKSQNDLNMSIATTFLNQGSRDRVLEQLTEAEDKLRAKLENRQITEDQYAKALEGLKDKLILEQRRSGTIFAEDFKSGRQTAREANILANESSMADLGSSFFDEFDNNIQDSYREAQLGAKDTARTIKSEFNNAFLSFADGTTTASDAFTKMALNISDKIQQLALEFSTNLLFGQLFGSASGFLNQFTGGSGGGGDWFQSLFGKSRGGIIKGYSSGGHVKGGSGVRDDVPAMLNDGEYVIKKSSVKKYGTKYLQSLNEGVTGKFVGGGESSFISENAYKYNDTFRPSQGSNVISPNLSLSAILDQDNPQNAARIKREDDLNRYLEYVESVKIANEKAYKENQQLNQKIRNDWENQQSQKSKGAWMAAGMGVAAAGLSLGNKTNWGGMFGSSSSTSSQVGLRSPYQSPYQGQTKWSPSDSSGRLKVGKALGGEIRKFAGGGGNNQDDVPALLMDGEFVLRKDAVKLYGKRFLDDLNTGRIKKLADGGAVGSSFPGDKNSSGGSSTVTATNNINITLNIDKNGKNTEQNDNMSNSNSAQNQKEENDKAKELADKIKNQVFKVITDQQRPGGLLSSDVYKKR